MIEKIESFSPELQVNAFRYCSVLHQRHVYVLIARSFHDVSSRIPKSSRRRKRERRGVEPTVGRSRVKIWIAHNIGSIICAKPENGPTGAAVVDLGEQCDCERSSCLQGHDSVCFPT